MRRSLWYAIGIINSRNLMKSSTVRKLVPMASVAWKIYFRRLMCIIQNWLEPSQTVRNTTVSCYRTSEQPRKTWGKEQNLLCWSGSANVSTWTSRFIDALRGLYSLLSWSETFTPQSWELTLPNIMDFCSKSRLPDPFHLSHVEISRRQSHAPFRVSLDLPVIPDHPWASQRTMQNKSRSNLGLKHIIYPLVN